MTFRFQTAVASPLGSRIDVTAYRKLKNGRLRVTCRVMPTKLDRSLPRKRVLTVLMHSLYKTLVRVLGRRERMNLEIGRAE